MHAPKERGTILLVAESRETASACAHLEAAGFQTIVERNSQVVSDSMARYCPDLILFDGTSVDDAEELVRRLHRDRCPDSIPIVVIDDGAKSDDVVRLLHCGATDCIRRPKQMSELVARVHATLRISRANKTLDEINARLCTEVDETTQRLTLLYDLNRSLNQASSRDEVLDLVFDAAVKATPSRRVSIMLADDSGDFLECVRAKGIDPDVVRRVRIRSDQGMAGHVFKTGRTYVSTRAEGDVSAMSPLLPLVPEPTNGRERYETDDFLSLPIYSPAVKDRRIMGVLNVTERSDHKRYVQSDVNCLSSIADSAAIGLDNQARREQAERSVEVLLHTVGHLAEFRDSETAGHLNRVCEYSSILALSLRENPQYRELLTDEFIRILRMAAPLHDIGKVGIPDDILMKPAPLTEAEYEIMKTHTELGRSTLAVALARTGPVPVLQTSVDIAYCHHEKFDGTGYPRGLRGTEIPLPARIVSLVDAYDAMTSKRCYKDSVSHDDSVEVINRDSGTHFDPDMVDAFLRCHEEFRAINCLPGMHDNEEPETLLNYAYSHA